MALFRSRRVVVAVVVVIVVDSIEMPIGLWCHRSQLWYRAQSTQTGRIFSLLVLKFSTATTIFTLIWINIVGIMAAKQLISVAMLSATSAAIQTDRRKCNSCATGSCSLQIEL